MSAPRPISNFTVSISNFWHAFWSGVAAMTSVEVFARAEETYIWHLQYVQTTH
jgi:hypothetical protein